jgi:hypothetical protein
MHLDAGLATLLDTSACDPADLTFGHDCPFQPDHAAPSGRIAELNPQLVTFNDIEFLGVMVRL